MLYYYISDLITRYRVNTIVIGYPSKQKDIQEKINDFMKALSYIIEHEKITIELVDEDYTSVQAGEIMSNFRKNAAEDTIAAMLILERYLESEKQQDLSKGYDSQQ
jgi:RNase H-fold protein (predicted Holliday junction resolvase)